MNKQYRGRYMGRTAAGDYIGKSRRTLYNWERKGIGPKVILGPNGLPLYDRENLDHPETWTV